MSENYDLTGVSVTFVIPHTPEAVGFASGERFLSLAAYHRHYCTVVSELGADVTVLYLDDEDPPDWETPYDIETRRVTAGSSYGMEFSASLYWSLARTDADVVHVHGYNQPNVLPVLASLAANDAATVVQNHGSALDYGDPKHWTWYQLLRFVFPRTVDQIVSVDRDELANFSRLGFSSTALTHLPNAVDTDLFHPKEQAACREELGIDVDAPQLLFVGKVTENKGVSYLAEAMADLPADTHLTLVYSGADADELARVRRLLESAGARQRVDFVGEVDQERLATYYNAADVCVFPSVNEGFGVVTLESMACETPVVATTEHVSGGHLRDGENALVADKGSVGDLVANVERLLTSPALREQIGRAGRETVEANYTWHRIGEELADVYRSALTADM